MSSQYWSVPSYVSLSRRIGIARARAMSVLSKVNVVGDMVFDLD